MDDTVNLDKDLTSMSAEAPEALKELEGKDAIYAMIAQYVEDKTKKKIGKSGGREIFDMVIEQVFALATGPARTMRFNGGFGSLHVRDYQSGERRLPSGQVVQFQERSKLRYEQGIVVAALVKNGGNLVEANKVKGSRAVPPMEDVELDAPDEVGVELD